MIYAVLMWYYWFHLLDIYTQYTIQNLLHLIILWHIWIYILCFANIFGPQKPSDWFHLSFNAYPCTSRISMFCTPPYVPNSEKHHDFYPSVLKKKKKKKNSTWTWLIINAFERLTITLKLGYRCNTYLTMVLHPNYTNESPTSSLNVI